jgi:hypothetical protein
LFSLDDEAVSIRDTFNRRRRITGVIALVALITLFLCGGSLSAQRPEEPLRLYTFEAAFLVFAIVAAYEYFFGLRCPRCKHSLALLANRKFWLFPKDVRQCPHCQLDLDADINATRTI